MFKGYNRHGGSVLKEKVVPGSLWKPMGGCYGKIHLVQDGRNLACGKSLCGLNKEWFTSWSKKPTVTCKICEHIEKESNEAH